MNLLLRTKLETYVKMRESLQEHIAEGNVFAHRHSFSKDFEKCVSIKTNLHVYTAFIAEVCKLITVGRKHHSAMTIIAFLRHETAVTSSDAVFKINNKLAADFAVLAMVMFPELLQMSFFEQRTSPERVLLGVVA